MKFIILEGPSTSGKSTVSKKLVDMILESGFSMRHVIEDETLMPVLKETDYKKHLCHLGNLLEVLEKKVDYVVSDRFHLTSAAVTNATISKFYDLEKALLKYDPFIIFLKINEEKLGERIFKAMEHRGPSWKAHVESKGSKDDIVNWYKQTQVNLLSLLNGSKIPHIIIDATDSDYDNITKQIFNSTVKN